ncbi:ATP-grasp domain-containing protein [Nocardioides panacisoli]|uniref:ATP-grasp domain-containing protein n=1 Tax=Nocardioides panacisoli TaxID=627624 RepID=UPI001C625BB7|nr:ATP-grasp domain-containing protein [Nocardioides panacisoli]QYJ05633.1 ATP-grasp domain-containing protein [Nocardioides panacisoli]
MSALRDPSPTVLLATCERLPDGEPGAAALEAALADRGIASRWVRWDDPAVDWTAADLVAVRSTWDYAERVEEFLAWSARVGSQVVHGPTVFGWNTHKGYLAELGAAGVPIVPTEVATTTAEVRDLVAREGSWVVKPAVGAGGRGVVLVDDPRGVDRVGGAGPWVVQPFVPSVAEAGEASVFVIDGAPVAQVAKRPASGEIRVHETYGGTSTPVALTEAATTPALDACATVSRLLGVDLVYARVDLLWWRDAWVVSEVELTEPGLYLDVMPENAGPFADALARRLGRSG